MDYLIIVIFILLIIIYILITTKNKSPKVEYSFINQEPLTNTNVDGNCLCVFDIDHTITCGNPKPMVDKCIEKGCRLAINTARPKKYIKDVDINALGFKKPHYNEDDFYYNPSSYSQHPLDVAKVKSNYLELLRNKYTIHDKKRVILLDDSEYNIEVAKNNGFSVIKARRDHYGCGLNHKDTDHLDQIL